MFADGRIGPETLEHEASVVFPLHLAVQSGSPETVEALLGAGFNVQRRNATGASAIGLAAQKGMLEIVEVLLRWPLRTCATTHDRT
jgi:ankyrin repeat protein